MTQTRTVIVHEKRRVFDNIFKIDALTLSHSRISGPGMIERAVRLVFERGDSAAALVHDTERDVVILAEQFRAPAYEKGPGWLIEPIAGSVEAGETAEACIRREMLEEIGYRAGALEPIASFYVTPGGSSERVHLYYAPVTPADLVDPAAAGLASQQEDVARVEIGRAAFIERCLAGSYPDAKTLIAGLWLAGRA